MSEKVRDEKNRWRNKIVAFRMSIEENILLDKFVKLSGLTKQEYLISRVLQRDVNIHANSRIYMAMEDSLKEVLTELQRIEKQSIENTELVLLTAYIVEMLYGFKENKKSPHPDR